MSIRAIESIRAYRGARYAVRYRPSWRGYSQRDGWPCGSPHLIRKVRSPHRAGKWANETPYIRCAFATPDDLKDREPDNKLIDTLLYTAFKIADLPFTFAYRNNMFCKEFMHVMNLNRQLWDDVIRLHRDQEWKASILAQSSLMALLRPLIAKDPTPAPIELPGEAESGRDPPWHRSSPGGQTGLYIPLC